MDKAKQNKNKKPQKLQQQTEKTPTYNSTTLSNECLMKPENPEECHFMETIVKTKVGKIIISKFSKGKNVEIYCFIIVLDHNALLKKCRLHTGLVRRVRI